MRYVSSAILLLISLAGCAPSFDPVAFEQRSRASSIDNETYWAVDRMFNELPDLAASRGTVVVGSVEDIHEVNTSTPFGNIISELVRTRLVQKGVNVQELRVRSSVLLERQSGEMLLSRDRRALLPPPSASEYVTGTYAVGSGKVYVSLKIIDAREGRILAAADFVTNKTSDVSELLGGDRT